MLLQPGGGVMEEALERYERFRRLVLELDLPVSRVHVLPARCPYCGKSDRVHALAEPGVERGVPGELAGEYAELWELFGGGRVGVCKFCHQLVRLSAGGGAEMLVEPGGNGG